MVTKCENGWYTRRMSWAHAHQRLIYRKNQWKFAVAAKIIQTSFRGVNSWNIHASYFGAILQQSDSFDPSPSRPTAGANPRLWTEPRPDRTGPDIVIVCRLIDRASAADEALDSRSTKYVIHSWTSWPFTNLRRFIEFGSWWPQNHPMDKAIWEDLGQSKIAKGMIIWRYLFYTSAEYSSIWLFDQRKTDARKPFLTSSFSGANAAICQTFSIASAKSVNNTQHRCTNWLAYLILVYRKSHRKCRTDLPYHPDKIPVTSENLQSRPFTSAVTDHDTVWAFDECNFPWLP